MTLEYFESNHPEKYQSFIDWLFLHSNLWNVPGTREEQVAYLKSLPAHFMYWAISAWLMKPTEEQYQKAISTISEQLIREIENY